MSPRAGGGGGLVAAPPARPRVLVGGRRLRGGGRLGGGRRVGRGRRAWTRGRDGAGGAVTTTADGEATAWGSEIGLGELFVGPRMREGTSRRPTLTASVSAATAPYPQVNLMNCPDLADNDC